MNNYYSIIAPAKLNLNLFVKGKVKKWYAFIRKRHMFSRIS